MLSNAPSSAMVYSVDLFVRDSMSTFRVSPGECRRSVFRGMRSLGLPRGLSRWCLYVQSSREVALGWNKPVDFLFLDGDHRYEAVRQDFQDWVGHVRPDGVLLFHDSRREEGAPEGVFARGWPGPTRLVSELKAHQCVELIEEAFSLTIWRRTSASCQKCLIRIGGG